MAPTMWTTGTAPNRLAALPSGLTGRIGGRIMATMNAAQQREVAELIEGAPADVLEVGHGPGVLLAQLAQRPGVRHVRGVDPSREMRVAAIRRCAEEIADGRVDVRDGDAASPGLPDESVDLAVSVNTVAIWPDLEAGVDGLHRVLRPGGQLLLSWHGGRQPGRAARRLVLADSVLDGIEASLAARFLDARRVLTQRCTVFACRR